MNPSGSSSPPAELAPQPHHPASPVDEVAPSGADRHDLGWAGVSLLSVAAVLVLLNGAAAQRWVAAAPVSQVTVALSEPAEIWARFTSHLGLDIPRLSLNRLWTWAEQARFRAAGRQISGKTDDPRSTQPGGAHPTRGTKIGS